MVNSNAKGRGGEYDVIGKYADALNVRLVRDLEQWRSADHGDLLADGDFDWPFTIEVKRYSDKTASVRHKPQWWAQVTTAAKAASKMPVLWYKYDRRPWRVVMKMNNVSFALGGTLNHEDHHLFTLDEDACFYLTREILAARAAFLPTVQ